MKLKITICLKVKNWWFSLGIQVSPINKTDSYDITDILLKVTLNTITLTLKSYNILDICTMRTQESNS